MQVLSLSEYEMVSGSGFACGISTAGATICGAIIGASFASVVSFICVESSLKGTPLAASGCFIVLQSLVAGSLAGAYFGYSSLDC